MRDGPRSLGARAQRLISMGPAFCRRACPMSTICFLRGACRTKNYESSSIERVQQSRGTDRLRRNQMEVIPPLTTFSFSCPPPPAIRGILEKDSTGLMRSSSISDGCRRSIGATALSVEPEMEQVFIACPDHITNPGRIRAQDYLYCATMPVILLINTVRRRDRFYIASLSYKTVVYKGQLTSMQVRPYFPT